VGIVYGLAAALCFGTADFVVTQAARRTGVLPALFAIQVLGLLAVSAVVLLAGAVPAPPSAAWGVAVAIGAVNFVGTLLLYRAFAVGTLAIVSPIASGFAVVTGLLAFAGGERPPGLVLLGAVLLVLGVAAVTGGGRAGGKKSLLGVPEAIGAALCLGTYFWALDGVTPTLGWLWPVLVTRAVQLAGAAGVLVVLRQLRPGLAGTGRNTGLFLLGAAVLDTAALLAFNLGLEQAYTTTTTALTSLYSAVAVLLAWTLRRERLSPGQWTGVGVILLGVLLVSL
jgi:drug/metabolite transporter (DMT)-like permease